MCSISNDPDKSGSEPEDCSELQSLPNSLVASEETMGVLGSALMGHMARAQQAQGLVSTQSGDQPASFMPLQSIPGCWKWEMIFILWLTVALHSCTWAS